MKDVLRLLESERETERRFVKQALSEPDHPTGWPAHLLMSHIASWREQLRDRLVQLRDGHPITPPPHDVDAFNAANLAQDARVPLPGAAKRSEQALAELIDMWDAMGERPFSWFTARTTGEALIRNRYSHPRIHLAEHFIERGDEGRGYRIYEESAAELRKAEAPGHILGPALYNLACGRVGQGRVDEALRLLEEALPMRADIRAAAQEDPDLVPLRDDPRFEAMVRDR
jgi:hypothetical protein